VKALYLFSIIVTLLITLFIGTDSAFAHTIPSPFTSSADKTEYGAGEIIKISGSVANEIIKANQPVIIQIFNPNGIQYENATVDLEPQESYTNGYYNYGYTYKYDLKIGDGSVPGNYQIVLYYDKSLQSSYTITYEKTHVDYNRYFVYNVFLNNETYPVRYKLTEGNEIHGMGSIDTANNFFSMAVRGTENKTGQLTVELPRTIIDSKYNNSTDKNFTIAMGGAGAMIGYTNDFKEIQKNAENRTLQFNIVPYDIDYLIFVYGTQSINQNMNVQNNLILSPLQQIKSGISASSVTCRADLVHIIKAEDGSPACVKPDSVAKLVERGWAVPHIMNFGYNPGRGPATLEQRNTTSINQQIKQVAPPCVSNIQHQYAIAGPPGTPLCPITNFQASAKILNASGFYGIYNYSKYPGTMNFVLEPGHNGTITYIISTGTIHNLANIPEYPNKVNIPNDVTFQHDAGMQNHPGVDVSAKPLAEIVGSNESAVVSITFSASQSALPGNYWVTLPPGFCAGGEMIILTVTDCTK
jgi:hypothetical protein